MGVGVNVVLSNRSQELIEHYINLCSSQTNKLERLGTSVDLAQLAIWLSNEVIISPDLPQDVQQEIEFTRASLRAELLHDLLKALNDGNPLEEIKKEQSSTFAAIQFVLLVFAGILLAGSEGFDSITTMLSVLSLPSRLILLAGLGFALLSIVVFCSYDLIQVAKNLGVTLRDAPKLLDIYLQQMDEIKGIRKKIDSYQLATLSVNELIQLKQTMVMLQERFQSLTETSAPFDKALNSAKVQRVKLVITILAGLLFFGSGFFAGQSVAMFVASLFTPVVLPTFWPVVLFSVLVGSAGLALYWYLEYDGLNKLVSGWFGLDEDKIEQLCHPNELDKESKKLELLNQKIITTIYLASDLNEAHSELIHATMAEEQQSRDPSVQNDSVKTPKIADNIFSFHTPPRQTAVQENLDQLSYANSSNSAP